MLSITPSTLFIHLAAFLLHALLPLRVIILEPIAAAAAPTARPIPMPAAADIPFFDDENIIYPPFSNILSFRANKNIVNYF